MKSVFRYKTTNAETMAAIREVEEMKRNPSLYKGYTDVDEMMRNLLKNDVDNHRICAIISSTNKEIIFK